MRRARHHASWAVALALTAACSGEQAAAPSAANGATNGTTVDSARATASEGGPATVWFADATEAMGLDFVHDAGFTAEKHLPETMGAGGLLADLNGDGSLDVYLVQSGPLPTGSSPERGANVPPNRTYLGRGGRLEDATSESGAAADRGYGMGATAGDVDGDGAVDIYVTNLGPDVLLQNDGHAHFTRPPGNGGIDDPRWTAGSAFFDADADGDLDLYVAAYLAVDLDHPSWCGRREPGWRSYCHPDEYSGLPDRFWRNRGDGTFEDATRAAGFDGAPGKGLGVLAADFDGDGHQDLYVANDSVENRMWRGVGDGTFRDDTLLSGTGVNANGATEAGMGLALGDVRGTGELAIVVTNLDHESNTLYEPAATGLWSDGTVRGGLEAASRMPVGFGVVLEDFDLDGDLDLAVANGHIIDNIQLYDDGQSWAQRPQLFENERGTFREVTTRAGALTASAFVGRGLYCGDLDGDGAPDLLLTQCGGPARLFRNVTGGRGARLRGAPVGTRVTALCRGGARLLRVFGGAPSYFGRSDDAVYLSVDSDDPIVALELVPPGGPLTRIDLTPQLGREQLLLEFDRPTWSIERQDRPRSVTPD